MKKIVWGKSSDKMDWNDKRLEWNEAKAWCEEQGGRLPKLWELMKAYEEKEEGFVEATHWSSSEYSTTHACSLYFGNGNTSNCNKTNCYYVRCVLDK
jgi:hypothetical protein